MDTKDRTYLKKILVISFVVLSMAFFYQLPTVKGYLDENNITYRREETNTDYGICVRYYDSDDNPVAPFGNFTMVEIDLDELGRIIEERYFNEQGRTVSIAGQYGNRYAYDKNGKQKWTTYIDQYGKPMVGDQGYTSTCSEYFEDGSIK